MTRWARAYVAAYRDLYAIIVRAPVAGWLLSAFPMPASRAARACDGLRRDIVWGRAATP